jgi:propanol-preferring alcohol dehydrogenase
MKAMVISATRDLGEGRRPLDLVERPTPEPGPGEVLLRVHACGVCHTELDEIEGRTPPPRFPVVPGHEVVGVVEGRGEGARRFETGQRAGVAWIFRACGRCGPCREGNENLCARFEATGRDADGGYAEFMTVPEAFAYPLPDALSDTDAAPLLCAGAIGHRSLRLSGVTDGQRLGLTGFGASAHLVLRLVRHRMPGTEVFVFARSPAERAFARELGAVWAGDTADRCPAPLHAVIDTTPAWKPVLAALACLAPGGRLVINAIRKEDGDRDLLRSLDYPRHLWMEKEIKSVANVARRDVEETLQAAAEMSLRPEVQTYPLEEANRALLELRNREIRGAKVLVLR